MIVDVKLKKPVDVDIGNGTDRWSTSQTSALFEVRDGEKLYGRLQVSRGGIRWWQGGSQVSPKYLKWADFIELLKQSG